MWVAFAVAADSRGLVERAGTTRADVVWDDFRVDRVQSVPLERMAEQLSQDLAGRDSGSVNTTNVGPSRWHRTRSRRRPHIHAMPAPPSARQLQLRQQQKEAR
jgi:hypothetical protein